MRKYMLLQCTHTIAIGDKIVSRNVKPDTFDGSTALVMVRKHFGILVDVITVQASHIKTDRLREAKCPPGPRGWNHGSKEGSKSAHNWM